MNQNKAIDKRVKELTDDFVKRVEERKSLERNWLLNVNFYAGNQYAEILPTGDISETAKRYFWQQTQVFNHIAPIIEARLAKFNNIRANVSVKQASDDENDVMTAKFSTALLRSIREENNFKKLMQEANYWSELTGTAFYKIGWSKNKGQCLSKEQNIYEGDVEITVCPPYEIFPDSLTATDVDECRSIIHAKAYPTETIEEYWGVKVNPDKVSIMKFDGVDGKVTGVTRSQKICSGDNEGYTLVLENYCAPSVSHPEGRLLIVAGDKVLYDGDLPYRNGVGGKAVLPFVRQVALCVPSSFFGTSLIERMIPVQRAYNEIKNRKHEFFNRITAGVLLAEDGSVDVDNLEEEGITPGKVILYRQGCNQPQMLNFGSVPKEFNEEEDRLLKEFVSISGVSDFLLNSAYVGTNLSGTALNLIQEQDNGRLCVTSESIRNAAKEVSRQLLRLYKQFACAGRLRRIAGENGGTELVAFKGSDISADDIVFDLDDESVSTVVGKKELVEEICKAGLLNGEDGKMSVDAKQKLLETLGFGSWNAESDIDSLHKKRAIKENQNIGVTVPEVQETDNHSIHIKEHTKRVIGGKELDKEQLLALRKHIAEHRAMLSDNQ